MVNVQSINLAQELEKCKKLKGRERAVDLKYLIDYVKKQEGEQGLKKVTEELKKNDIELPDLTKIDDMDWISVSLINIFFVTAIKVFNWQERDCYEAGRNAPSYSPTIKLFARYLLSLKRSMILTSKNWNKWYTRGRTEWPELDEQNYRAVMWIHDFDAHPFTCLYLAGVFSKLGEIMSGKRFSVKETNCPNQGGRYHEFIFSWK